MLPMLEGQSQTAGCAADCPMRLVRVALHIPLPPRSVVQLDRLATYQQLGILGKTATPTHFVPSVPCSPPASPSDTLSASGMASDLDSAASGARLTAPLACPCLRHTSTFDSPHSYVRQPGGAIWPVAPRHLVFCCFIVLGLFIRVGEGQHPGRHPIKQPWIASE